MLSRNIKLLLQSFLNLEHIEIKLSINCYAAVCFNDSKDLLMLLKYLNIPLKSEKFIYFSSHKIMNR